VLDALVQQRSAHRQFVAASKAVESGRLALEYAQQRYDQGVITAIELNTMKTNLSNSTANLINAKYQYMMASKYLDVLQGVPITL
jgi:outer membrane protein